MIINEINDFLLKTYLQPRFPHIKIIGEENLNSNEDKPTIFVANYNLGTFPIIASYKLNQILKQKGSNRKIAPVIPINLIYKQWDKGLTTWETLIKKITNPCKQSLKNTIGRAIVANSNIIDLYKLTEENSSNSEKNKALDDVIKTRDLLILPTGSVSVNGRIDYQNPKVNPTNRFSMYDLKHSYSSLKGELNIQPIYFIKDTVSNIHYISIGTSENVTETMINNTNWYIDLMKDKVRFLTTIQVKQLKKLIDRKEIYEITNYSDLLNNLREKEWQIPNLKGSVNEEFKDLYVVSRFVNNNGKHDGGTMEIKTYRSTRMEEFQPEKKYTLNQAQFLKEAIKEFFETNYKVLNPKKADNFWEQF